jgi:DNA polymerase III alpha subunit
MSNEYASTLPADDWGRIVISYDDAIELLYSSVPLNVVSIADSAELAQFNDMCRLYDKSEETIHPAPEMPVSPEEFHAEQSRRWLTTIDSTGLWEGLLEKCTTDEERTRFLYELEEYERRDMLQVLVQLNGMIKILDAANVVRGVGRGSSVASFVLYLMGVHFINPLLYDLDVSEFLK